MTDHKPNDQKADQSKVNHALDTLHEHIGQTVGISEWVVLDQDRIDRFAHATDDHQYIHVDPVRAADSHFGQTVAHGMLTLSILPAALLEHGLRPEGTNTVINYGFEKVRFLEPVFSGQSVRVEIGVGAVEEMKGGMIKVHYDAKVHIKDHPKPAAIASMILLYVLEKQG